MNELRDAHSTDCRSDEGITVGLVDSILTAAHLLASRDLTPPAVQAALRDLRADADFLAHFIGLPPAALLSEAQPSPEAQREREEGRIEGDVEWVHDFARRVRDYMSAAEQGECDEVEHMRLRAMADEIMCASESRLVWPTAPASPPVSGERETVTRGTTNDGHFPHCGIYFGREHNCCAPQPSQPTEGSEA
jgi:hypothetical protein